MIAFEQAYQMVLNSAKGFGVQSVPLHQANGRILAEDVLADRDFPPFDRATKDGIAIFLSENKPLAAYKIAGVVAAGSSQQTLQDQTHCLEIMTGAVLPKNTNTVVMYEDIHIKNGLATVAKPIKIGQNIHLQGSDESKGSIVLSKGTTISAAEIGVLAAVGKAMVPVKKTPSICLFSTGDELVAVDQKPLAHQIRQSNAYSLKAALANLGIVATIKHIVDDESTIKNALETALKAHDVLLISGGVSKGKFDYLPAVLEAIGVHKHFHRVKQRPGKPFWFGEHPKTNSFIFGFPGNPVSTFVNFHLYFRPWLNQCLEQKQTSNLVLLKEAFTNQTNLNRFISAKVTVVNGQLEASLILGNGSGDLTSLAQANGFVQVSPKQSITAMTKVPFVPTRKILW